MSTLLGLNTINTTKKNVKVGDYLEGGQCFYIDQTGPNKIAYCASVRNYLVNDVLHSGVFSTSVPVQNGTSLYDGYTNTLELIWSPAHTAANYCYNHDSMGYTGWYLPALKEMIYFAYLFSYGYKFFNKKDLDDTNLCTSTVDYQSNTYSVVNISNGLATTEMKSTFSSIIIPFRRVIL